MHEDSVTKSVVLGFLLIYTIGSNGYAQVNDTKEDILLAVHSMERTLLSMEDIEAELRFRRWERQNRISLQEHESEWILEIWEKRNNFRIESTSVGKTFNPAQSRFEQDKLTRRLEVYDDETWCIVNLDSPDTVTIRRRKEPFHAGSIWAGLYIAPFWFHECLQESIASAVILNQTPEVWELTFSLGAGSAKVKLDPSIGFRATHAEIENGDVLHTFAYQYEIEPTTGIPFPALQILESFDISTGELQYRETIETVNWKYNSGVDDSVFEMKTDDKEIIV